MGFGTALDRFLEGVVHFKPRCAVAAAAASAAAGGSALVDDV